MISSGIASSSTTASAATCVLDGSYDILYDVFLSFRGEDTRKSFADHLYTALNGKRIHTFRDEEEIRMGEALAPAISKAIKGSRVFVVIFSKNFADSGWCLNELDEIMECRRKTGRIVYPIFYHVDPSHVRKQEGDYGTPFSLYEENADKEKMAKIKRWKAALREASELKGKHVEEQHESVVIKEVIKEIWDEMASKPFIMDCPSTNEFILKDLVKFMNIQSEDVHMIGIYGEDGLGKTAIAQAICNEISSQFEGCSFLANIRKVSKEYFGLQRLQEQLFRDILVLRGNREIIFHRRNDVIKQICCRKVLIILDDVDELEQLQFLARESNWFGKGSMIIITCTDKEILTRHSVKLSYELTKLKNPEDVRLFTQHAISKGRSLCNIHKLLERAIDYCCGLPLALKVVGTFLKTKTREQWEKALVCLERHQGEFNKKNLEDVLRLSFEELRDNEKDVFFDVACFFNGEHINFVTKILDGRGFSAKDGIQVLRDRCLLTISDQKLWMHNSIQDVGREMVRQENKKEGKRSRLWDHDNVEYVLTHNKGTDAIEGIVLDLSELNQLQFTTEAFAKMTELRVLKFFMGYLSDCHLSDGVIPSDFWRLSSLERLNLSGNDFTVIPEGIAQLSKLSFLQLGYCQRLLGIPNLPSTVQEVDAHVCSSLRPSSNFRDATTILWRIQNLAPNNEFCILLPGSGIPDWFGDRKMGCSVAIEKLPPEWHQVNFLGFAVCFVFASEHEIPEHTPVVSCKINDFRFSYAFSCGRGENEFVESDHLWLAYQPRARVENFHPYDWTQIKASFEVFGIGTRNKVKECAISLIYADR
ncbi:hypothetical protein VitviT2T_029170 [Vitis vinifera]|uniref:ADP-ribosyl cyclase/cyclic ADP-ribose hydrolase n=1 Tax=Vitis vinifera TaxID=29760 RepID=A0ABY9DXP7_VITVI|nr:hypothetical protein VitviT2T_029170 [Vitis vinifera]